MILLISRLNRRLPYSELEMIFQDEALIEIRKHCPSLDGVIEEIPITQRKQTKAINL